MRHALLLSLTLLAAVGCGGGGGEAGPKDTAAFTFESTLASGTVEFSNEQTSAGTGSLYGWIKDADLGGDLEVRAFRPESAPNGTGLRLFIPPPHRTGTYRFDLEACGTTPRPADCASITIAFGTQSTAGGAGPTALLDINQGSLTVTAVSGDRVEGTFSGTGVYEKLGGGGSAPAVLTEGRFNAPLIPYQRGFEAPGATQPQ